MECHNLCHYAICTTWALSCSSFGLLFTLKPIHPWSVTFSSSNFTPYSLMQNRFFFSRMWPCLLSSPCRLEQIAGWWPVGAFVRVDPSFHAVIRDWFMVCTKNHLKHSKYQNVCIISDYCQEKGHIQYSCMLFKTVFYFKSFCRIS